MKNFVKITLLSTTLLSIYSPPSMAGGLFSTYRQDPEEDKTTSFGRNPPREEAEDNTNASRSMTFSYSWNPLQWFPALIYSIWESIKFPALINNPNLVPEEGALQKAARLEKERQEAEEREAQAQEAARRLAELKETQLNAKTLSLLNRKAQRNAKKLSLLNKKAQYNAKSLSLLNKKAKNEIKEILLIKETAKSDAEEVRSLKEKIKNDVEKKASNREATDIQANITNSPINLYNYKPKVNVFNIDKNPHDTEKPMAIDYKSKQPSPVKMKGKTESKDKNSENSQSSSEEFEGCQNISSYDSEYEDEMTEEQKKQYSNEAETSSFFGTFQTPNSSPYQTPNTTPIKKPPTPRKRISVTSKDDEFTFKKPLNFEEYAKEMEKRKENK